MKNKNVSYWYDIDLLLCFFISLVCGILSFNKILHIIGAVSFAAMIVVFFCRKLYYKDRTIKRTCNYIMIFVRIVLFTVLLIGLIMNYSYLKHFESPF